MTGIAFEKGSYVLVRASDAGVHAGELVTMERDCVQLRDSRRLWRWRAGAGDFLSGVARYGVVHADSRIGGAIDIIVIGACEIIACTSQAEESLRTAPADSE